MSRFKDRVCDTCGITFSPSGPRSIRCPDCNAKHKREYQKAFQMEWRAKNGDPTVGLGKGGSNKKGEENAQFKSGMGQFYRIRKQLKKEINKCEHCGKDLSTAGRFEWCVRHKDQNRSHNTRDNLILLCKACHQIEHECWKAFEGATTIPQGSRAQVDGARSA